MGKHKSRREGGDSQSFAQQMSSAVGEIVRCIGDLDVFCELWWCGHCQDVGIIYEYDEMAASRLRTQAMSLCQGDRDQFHPAP